MEIEWLKEELRNIEAVLIQEDLALGLLLKSFSVYASSSVPTAATDSLRIYVNPEFFKSLEPRDRVRVLLHELLHILLLHVQRARRFMEVHNLPESAWTTLNMVADLIVESRMPEKYADKKTLNSLPANVLEKARKRSFEELAEELMNLKVLHFQPVFGNDLNAPTPSDAVVVREAEESVDADRGSEGSANVEEYVKAVTTRALIIARMGGNKQGWLERIVEELLKPKVDWRTLLRAALEKRLGRQVKRTWSRPSRKGEHYPGKELLGIKRVVVLVDTSGSIDEETLRLFVSEVYGVAKAVGELTVIPWDATPYAPIRIKRASDVKRLRLTGGGDTRLLPALREALSMNPNLIVILSDWCLFDMDNSELRRLLGKNRNRIIACTTAEDPPVKLKTIRL